MRARSHAMVWFIAAVFVFQLAIWSARLGNADTGFQLVGTVHLAETGSFGLTTTEAHSIFRSTGAFGQFAQGTDGRWYQAHDPGNKVLMLPAAIVARVIGRQPDGDLYPSSVTKVLASASIAAFVSLLPVLLYLALRTLLPERRALRWAALGLVATLLLPYSKGTWDVYPCAVFVAATVLMTLRRLSGEDTKLVWIGSFVAAAGASWFRFSLAPFLLLGCATVEIIATSRTGKPSAAWIPRVATGTVVFLAAVSPVFAMNARVTGNPFRPPISVNGSNSIMQHFPLTGVIGLLGAPNRGLWVFSPILVLVIAVAWMWRTLPRSLRWFVAGWILPVGAYMLAIGSIETWGQFGWGPRYLVPIVPILWIPTAIVGARAVDGRSAARVAVIALLALSIAIAAVGTLTNWEAVSAISPSVVAQDTAYPKQIIESASHFGREIPVRDDPFEDAGVDTKRWPDLASLYATRKAGLPDAVGYLAFIILLAVAGALYFRADRELDPPRTAALISGGEEDSHP